MLARSPLKLGLFTKYIALKLYTRICRAASVMMVPLVILHQHVRPIFDTHLKKGRLLDYIAE